MLICNNNVFAKCTLTASQQECLHNARMLVKHNHYPEAMQFYNKILARVHNNLTLVREVEHTCKRCRQGSANCPQTIENIAAAYNHMRYRYTALFYYKKLLKEQPNSIK